MRITIAQLNPTVGDVSGNLRKLIEAFRASQAHRPDLVAFPELYLTGYPPRDLVVRNDVLDGVESAVREIESVSAAYPETGILFGAPIRNRNATGKGLYNAALLVHAGKTVFRQFKSLLPTYDVFDEGRYFDPVFDNHIMPFKGQRLGISICEDAWNDPELWLHRIYSYDPIDTLAAGGASILINISASPFHYGKDALRFRIVQNHARKHRLPFVFVNQVGGNDELVFDGRSLCVDDLGRPLHICPGFEESLHTVDLDASRGSMEYEPMGPIGSVESALVLGLRDYMRKTGFSSVVLGLSGGIDSALVAALAVKALGADRVRGISMPGPFSSTGSIDDAKALAGNLGIPLDVIPITDVYDSYIRTLQPFFEGRAMDIAEENIQARIRGNYLMAMSNKFGHLVLSTGNKSELAVGYCTLYGDMSGGLALISDVPKTMVYRLAEHINRDREIIPRATIEKPPSAELRPDQCDQDTLPPYETLDEILRLYLDESLPGSAIVQRGFDPETVRWVIRVVDRNEYKRKQAAPGLKVTSKAFGMGRRMPIAARY